MSTELQKKVNDEIVLKLNDTIKQGYESNKLQGFERAYVLANATKQLKDLLTKEYMQPIMMLQGNKLGFKTDRDTSGGYDENVIKNCLIEAVLTGVQVVGNQFNIIAGNCYITKEGFGYLLNNVDGLDYEITAKLPRINADSTSAAIVMVVEWSFFGGEKHLKELDIPIRMNKMMGTDAVIGKATRKARHWLYNRISGLEIAEGDAEELRREKTPFTEAKIVDIPENVVLNRVGQKNLNLESNE